MLGELMGYALPLSALACSVLALAIAARKTPSASARLAFKSVCEVEARYASEVELFKAERTRWQGEFAGIAERCEEILDRAESKRKRVAAQNSRNLAPEPSQPQTRAEIIEAARSRMRSVP